MNILPYFLPILLLGCLNGCTPPPEMPNTPPPPPSAPATYLALGDSYTIGESVAESERWPAQLATQLQDSGIEGYDPRIVAKTGWTTKELMDAIEAEQVTDTFGLVSLLIGVNNQFRRYSFETYEAEFPMLLETAIGFAGGDTSRVFVVSIPDYGVTPFGQSQSVPPETVAEELDKYNSFAKQHSASLGIPFIDITPISREALDRPELIATDRLHPSGLMYREWVEVIYPVVKEMLGE
ncbi:MAG: SGNH/GDSL hydrolase family protein [Bacteroidota bacterium]